MGDQRSSATAANGTMMSISDSEFASLRQMIYSRFGINLTEQKRSLLVGRLQKMLRTNRIDTFEDYYRFLENDTSGKAVSDLINLISTNYTYFNREKDHFDYYLNTALPAICEEIRNRGEKTSASGALAVPQGKKRTPY